MVTFDRLTVVRNGVKLLDDINLTINPGDFTLLFGENGAGKSTFLKTLVGLENSSNGSSESIRFEPIRNQAVNFSYMPERDVIKEETVVEHLINAFILANKIKSKCVPEAFISKLSDKLEIRQFQKRTFGSLSKGEKKRILFFISLLSDYDLLVLDEPLDGFDLPMKSLLLELIEESRNQGEQLKSVVISSHDPDSVIDHISKIIFLKKGKLEDVIEVSGNASVTIDSLKKRIHDD